MAEGIAMRVAPTDGTDNLRNSEGSRIGLDSLERHGSTGHVVTASLLRLNNGEPAIIVGRSSFRKGATDHLLSAVARC